MWELKLRASPGAPMTAQYECPYHGRFDAQVTRQQDGDPPRWWPCPCPVKPARSWGNRPETPCATPSEWRISAPGVHTQFVVSVTQGKPAPKPHPYSMDTRKLAEGRKNDFRRERKRVREELRQKRVKEFLK